MDYLQCVWLPGKTLKVGFNSRNEFKFIWHFFPPPPLPVGVFSILPWQGTAFRILMSIFHPSPVVCLISSSLGNNSEVYCLVNMKKHWHDGVWGENKIPGCFPTVFCIPKFPTTACIKKTWCGYFRIKITKILQV